MGLLDRAIKNGISRGISEGISKGVGQAVGKAAERVIAPRAEAYANAAAKELDAATQAMNQSAQELGAAASRAESECGRAQSAAKSSGFAGLESALTGWAQSAQSFATEAAKNMKVCPKCGNPATADNSFCPNCGTKLPEETLAQGAVCPSCGRQNTVGTKFCAGCGTKLPSAVAEEKAAAARDAAVLAQWAEKLPQYPVWSCGGTELSLESGDGYYIFSAVLESDFAAQNAVNKYREALLQNGFRQAGQYPCREHLYKKVGGVCCHVDTEHCFDGDGNAPTLYFNMEEPTGGFDYVKPAPQKEFNLKNELKGGLKDLLRR